MFYVLICVMSTDEEFIVSTSSHLFFVVTCVTSMDKESIFGTLLNLFFVVTHVTSMDEESIFGTSLNLFSVVNLCHLVESVFCSHQCLVMPWSGLVEFIRQIC